MKKGLIVGLIILGIILLIGGYSLGSKTKLDKKCITTFDEVPSQFFSRLAYQKGDSVDFYWSNCVKPCEDEHFYVEYEGISYCTAYDDGTEYVPGGFCQGDNCFFLSYYCEGNSFDRSTNFVLTHCGSSPYSGCDQGGCTHPV